MKNIFPENQLYLRLARGGDPSAFYALFCDHIRSLYILLRSRGQDHQAACAGGAEAVSLMYSKFLKRRPAAAHRWFEAGCGLKGFDPAQAGASASEAEIADYVRRVGAALQKDYSGWLDRNGGRGSQRDKRSLLPYAVGTLAAACVAAFLFFSGAVVSISFERFGMEYSLSFPKISKGLGKKDGPARTGGAAPARPGGTPASGQ